MNSKDPTVTALSSFDDHGHCGGYTTLGGSTARVEALITSGSTHAGLVLVLANDPSYWRARTHDRLTNADAFRLHEGLTLAGSRAWGPRTGPGTMGANRTTSIVLSGEYPLAWRDYSELAGPRGQFRYLAVGIANGARRPGQ